MNIVKQLACVAFLLSATGIQATLEGDENGPTTPRDQTVNMKEVSDRASNGDSAATLAMALFSLTPTKDPQINAKIKAAAVNMLLLCTKNKNNPENNPNN